MKVALIVQEDSAATCLAPLAAMKCEVLAVGLPQADASGCCNVGCSIFAKRCVELGFSFVSMPLQSAGPVVQTFRPDVVVFVSDADIKFPEALAVDDNVEKYVLCAGKNLSGAPWPEFAPIWLQADASSASLLKEGTVVGKLRVHIGEAETAATLCLKHADAKAALLSKLVQRAELVVEPCEHEEAATVGAEQVPASIGLNWTEDRIDRYVRAHFMPPLEAAQVVDPATGEAYFIECMEQFQEFKTRILRDPGAAKKTQQGAYAADTHWYSNVGGTIVKMGDSDIHMPARVADKRRPAVIPGAALQGRKKLRMNEPLIGPNAERYCSAALSSGWIGVEGPHVKQFEKMLARICGCTAACAVHSGTAALYGAMKALGVEEPSHHVLVPAFTCAACADAIVHAGGQPVPIDCDMDSFGVSAEAVRKGLDENKNIVGVVVAPCYGVPVRDFYEIYTLCKERGLWLCEDACESYGARQVVPDPVTGQLTSVAIGALSTLCVISVRSEKMIGVGEGGAILGNDATLVARAKWWCSRAPSRGVGLWRVYEHDAVGQNFRLPEMLAAVGCAAAEMLPVMVERKKNLHLWYEEGIAAREELIGVKLQKCARGDEPVWWITAALLPNNMNGEAVGMQLMADCPDIEIRPGFFPLGSMGIFKSQWAKACPNAEALYHGLVCLPSSHQLTKPDIERVCDALAASVKKVACASP